VRKRSISRKLLLSKETVRSLVPEALSYAVGGDVPPPCRRISYGGPTACDCSSGSDTCWECSTMQY
jgi:hypothetical protein